MTCYRINDFFGVTSYWYDAADAELIGAISPRRTHPASEHMAPWQPFTPSSQRSTPTAPIAPMPTAGLLARSQRDIRERFKVEEPRHALLFPLQRASRKALPKAIQSYFQSLRKS